MVRKVKKLDAVINLSYLKNKNWGKKFLKLKQNDVKENLFLQLGTTILTSQKIIEYFLKTEPWKFDFIFFYSRCLHQNFHIMKIQI